MLYNLEHRNMSYIVDKQPLFFLINLISKPLLIISNNAIKPGEDYNTSQHIMSTDKKNVRFYTITEFKTRLALSNENAQVIKNPNTGKLFLSIGANNYKCQQDIDSKKEMKMIVEDDAFELACLTNIKPSADNVLFTL